LTLLPSTYFREPLPDLLEPFDASDKANHPGDALRVVVSVQNKLLASTNHLKLGVISSFLPASR